ncbi:L,D-transpeptidase [Methylocaldum sp.]|uniref:L,D-transpeptidase n=1 Tax=Methylocaldum sp. TaxID=1969727 RepID=UPI002D21FAC8|nr:L,D-transpeptidase [Methylocaldum sp.]HYE33812.1 L,D-transpeptidase [Methylocaldum sp.]
MDKARSAAVKFIASCMVALLFYPKTTAITSQARNALKDHYVGNPPDQPMPYRITDDEFLEADSETASILGQKQYEPLIVDTPPEFGLSTPSNGHVPKQAVKSRALVIIKINQADQRLSVQVDGEMVQGLESVLVSTGRPGKATRTPDGTYSPLEMAVRRQSHFASRLMNRPVYLTHVIQIVNGIFMHDAADAAMEHLGKKRSYGCVRVDRRKMPTIFRLVKRHRSNTEIHIFH